MKVQAKNQLHALQVTIHTPLQVIDDAKLLIEHLESQIGALEGCALKISQTKR